MTGRSRGHPVAECTPCIISCYIVTIPHRRCFCTNNAVCHPLRPREPHWSHASLPCGIHSLVNIAVAGYVARGNKPMQARSSGGCDCAPTRRVHHIRSRRAVSIGLRLVGCARNAFRRQSTVQYSSSPKARQATSKTGRKPKPKPKPPFLRIGSHSP